VEQAKKEVLRYLGYRHQALEPALERTVEQCMAELRAAAGPRRVWRLFPVEPQEAGIRLGGTALVLGGGDIRRHLGAAEMAAVLAVTLGAAADALIRRWEHTDLTRSVILDACATQYVEELCDGVEREIREEAQKLGLEANSRYSPGYGDLPLEAQPGILGVLDASRRIGLTCTGSLILLPRKSVTALMGLFPKGEAASGGRGCEGCALRETCQFRKDGEPGGCESLA